MAESQKDFVDLFRSNLEGMVTMMRATLDEAERLRTQQLEAIQSALAQNAELGREIAGAGTAEELFALQTKFASHQVDVALGYWSKLFAAASHTQFAAMKQFETQAAQFNDSVASMMDQAPAGSEPIVAAMKSFLQAGRAACGIGAQATEQAAKLAEAQFETATAGIRDVVANARKRSA
jgi:phasin family protein